MIKCSTLKSAPDALAWAGRAALSLDGLLFFGRERRKMNTNRKLIGNTTRLVMKPTYN